jgi:4,5-dihydroxyphthalate decarboxylase
MTSSVWHRLILRQIDGVAQNEVQWVTCAGERMGALGYPNGVDVRLDTSGRSPRDLLKAGAVDATMEPGAGPPAEPDDAIAPAFLDLKAAQRGYYEQTHLFPIMHMIVMKEDLAEREPWAVGALCQAFQAAKEIGGPRALEGRRERPLADSTPEEVQDLLGRDPWPYGIRSNTDVLETFLRDAKDQGLTDRVMAVDELFASNLPEAFR